MHSFVIRTMQVLLMGLGATLIFDLWGLFLRQAFKVAPSSMCLVGRWLRSMPEGTFRHADPASAPPRRAECALGWIAHYMIGIAFATVFVALAGSRWLQHPTLFPAMLFGIVTVLAPFFILQPAFGQGIAASKTPNPNRARGRSLMNHAIFGFGLYLSGLVIGWLF